MRNKFRAWDEDCEIMYYSDAGWNKAHPESEDCIFDFHEGRVVAFLRQTEPGTIDEPPYDYGEPVECEEYTGKKDKDGTEIYEGDIVQYYSGTKLSGKKEYRIALIGYVQEVCQFNIIDKCWVFDLSCGFIQLNLKVIGNNHEHPHLLENAK